MSTFYMRIDKHEDVCIVFKKTHAACAIMCAHEYIRIIRLWKRSKEVPKGKDWAEYAVLVSACSVMLQTFCGDTERNNGNQNNLSQCIILCGSIQNLETLIYAHCQPNQMYQFLGVPCKSS